ncbi:hypothetical protein J2046_000262 [Rhizobium petrolearium]|uniref:Uncharacterized protein n=1 Tax=Neorhizobium petrolearium TaxID=515361 RepID=A0ABY8M3Y6_9HYPH|nr:hypothetical protein [Neorhizobium petrolearium]MBP1842018.1 hypothetical protein [Neorhizobium petrolearium]MCC2608398.1 hypothetical protein [Neorhizobium petrolearium]WGI68676.1 hypothetical protein QEO92_00820 [Neorhizobium petrolearium]
MRMPIVKPRPLASMEDVAQQDFEWQAGIQQPEVPLEVDYPKAPPTTLDDWERLEIED